MKSIVGKTFEYIYENGDSYRVSLEEDSATWTALSGSATGSTGTETYDCAQVAPNTFLVAWLEETGESVTFVLNVEERVIYCSYIYEKDRFFLQGQLTSIA